MSVAPGQHLLPEQLFHPAGDEGLTAECVVMHPVADMRQRIAIVRSLAAQRHQPGQRAVNLQPHQAHFARGVECAQRWQQEPAFVEGVGLRRATRQRLPRGQVIRPLAVGPVPECQTTIRPHIARARWLPYRQGGTGRQMQPWMRRQS
jgi:hypothetical protein